jgi:hypothetical protein
MSGKVEEGEKKKKREEREILGSLEGGLGKERMAKEKTHSICFPRLGDYDCDDFNGGGHFFGGGNGRGWGNRWLLCGAR